jgi:hypothetical protein
MMLTNLYLAWSFDVKLTRNSTYDQWLVKGLSWSGQCLNTIRWSECSDWGTMTTTVRLDRHWWLQNWLTRPEHLVNLRTLSGQGCMTMGAQIEGQWSSIGHYWSAWPGTGDFNFHLSHPIRPLSLTVQDEFTRWQSYAYQSLIISYNFCWHTLWYFTTYKAADTLVIL